MSSSEDITADALKRMEGCSSARLSKLMGALIRHIHDLVREHRLTEAEWAAAIDFLTRTGKMCSPERQEFILLSDVLGVSMVLDAVNHRADARITESTVFGPFYSAEQPELPFGASILKRAERGDPFAV